jgi:hypothetical protein
MPLGPKSKLLINLVRNKFNKFSPESGRETIMTRLMPLGHNPSTSLMPQGHKVRVYGNLEKNSVFSFLRIVYNF